MKLETQATTAILLLPFVVSGLWYVSPWLGIPSVVVALPLWVGSILLIKEKQ